MKYLAFIILVFTLLSNAYATEKSPIEGLPQELWDSAEKNSCKSLLGFYAKTESYNPPFAFNLFKDDISSAAYICDVKNRKIVIWQRNDILVKVKPFSCPKVISTDRFSMGGISMTHEKVNFSKLYDLNQKKGVFIKGPNVSKETFLLRLDYYGLNSVLACHGGKWYFNNYD